MVQRPCKLVHQGWNRGHIIFDNNSSRNYFNSRSSRRRSRTGLPTTQLWYLRAHTWSLSWHSLRPNFKSNPSTRLQLHPFGGCKCSCIPGWGLFPRAERDVLGWILDCHVSCTSRLSFSFLSFTSLIYFFVFSGATTAYDPIHRFKYPFWTESNCRHCRRGRGGWRSGGNWDQQRKFHFNSKVTNNNDPPNWLRNAKRLSDAISFTPFF